jgi:RNA polymerase sigma-70 factor (ECF subfamily)
LAIHTENLYRTYGPMVLRRCRKLLRHEDDARDAMHDVFVQLLLHANRLEDRGQSSLLYRIATNVCLNRLRGRARRGEQADDSLAGRIASAADDAARSSARSMLSRLFRRDDGSTATMAVLHLVDGMTLEEVAGEVGMSVSGVRKRLRRLRAELVELEGM